MQDTVESSQGPVPDQPHDPLGPLPLVLPPRRRSTRSILLAALLAFFVGGGLAGWLVWRGDLDAVLPESEAAAVASPSAQGSPPQDAAPALAKLTPEQAQAGLGSVETRLALLEDRFSRIDQQAGTASANASRAEALLIALAVRRMIDKGEPLGYLEYQLKLRFGGAQPHAVQTIIAASKRPVTISLLSSQLEAAAPALSGERRNESTWTRARREISSLFVLRRSASPAAKPLDRAERAQILLKAGRITDAIAEVERLPGADEAQDWIAAARKYDEAQRALEVIETTAMLEPRTLRDGEGITVKQPSPLTQPAAKADASN